MKNRTLIATTMVLLLGLLTSGGCGISGGSLRATAIDEVRPTVATEARQTAGVEIETAVAATLTSVAATPLPPIEVAFKSFHGRYVTAMAEDDDWALRQETELSPCAWFTLEHLVCGKIALKTCHGRYVTAPRTGGERRDWMLTQEPTLSDYGRFDLYELGNDSVALKTCAGQFVTAGDGGWPWPLTWALTADTDVMGGWEISTILTIDQSG